MDKSRSTAKLVDNQLTPGGSPNNSGDVARKENQEKIPEKKVSTFVDMDEEENTLETEICLMENPELKHISPFGYIWRLAWIFTFLYAFICSLDLLASSFRLLGGEAAGQVFNNKDAIGNPIAGLMIGVLATVLVQSSSTSSSIVVAMVASSILDVPTAVPIIMGANIGTSVTNTIVSLSQIREGGLFERSFAAATVHDMFNVLTVLLLLPVEWASHFLVHLSDMMVDGLSLKQNANTEIKLLSVLTDPVTDHIVQVDKKVIMQISMGKPLQEGQQLLKVFCDDLPFNTTSHGARCPALFSYWALSDRWSGGILLLISLFVLFACLVFLVKTLKSIFQGHISTVINKTVNADFPGKFKYLTGYVAIFVGVIMTILVQSSSIFTSTLTPLVGLNVITLERAFPLTLGSNIGTTVTSLLAALAAGGDKFRFALQISFCHLLFNVLGIVIWYPLSFMRQVPLQCARKLGKTTREYRWFAFAYIIFMFMIIPGLVFALSMAGTVYLLIVVGIIFGIAVLIFTLKLLQKKCPQILPETLRTFKFLPKCIRSLRPFHDFWAGLYRKVKSKQAATLNRVRRTTESSMGFAQDAESNDKGKQRKKGTQNIAVKKPLNASPGAVYKANLIVHPGQEAHENLGASNGVLNKQDGVFGNKYETSM